MDIEKFLADLEEFNNLHDNEINLTEGEKALEDLRQAVNQLKADRKAKEEANRNARKMAVDKSNNIAVNRYVAMVNNKKKEFKEMYY